MPWLARKDRLTRSGGGGIVASARVLNVSDHQEARRLGRIRQSWQSEAWTYRRALPELRYATAYLGNSAMRMILYPGVVVSDNELPVPLSDAGSAVGLPADLIAAAGDCIQRLRDQGPFALPMMLKRMAENFEVAGECFITSNVDPIVGNERWSIKSVSEVVEASGGGYGLREAPGTGASADVVPLRPGDFIARLWWPDPEFAALADSPFQSIRESCEELLLLSREIRALARSRLANSGLLLLPDTLTSSSPAGETDNLEDDPLYAELIEAATAALTDEGAASSVVPIISRMSPEAIAAVKYLSFNRPLDAANTAKRMEVIGRIATGLDLPNDVLNGKADLNHWTSWNVDDDTFRHHIEPLVIVIVDAFTGGFLWPMLDAYNRWDPALVRQVLIWYDPTELVTKPDRSVDAYQAWDRLAISDEALRKYLGFPDADAPQAREILMRMATHTKSLDPQVQAALLNMLDPKINLPMPPPAGSSAAIPIVNPPPVASIGTDANPGPPATGGPNTQPPSPEEATVDAIITAALDRAGL